MAYQIRVFPEDRYRVEGDPYKNQSVSFLRRFFDTIHMPKISLKYPQVLYYREGIMPVLRFGNQGGAHGLQENVPWILHQYHATAGFGCIHGEAVLNFLENSMIGRNFIEKEIS